MSTSPQIGGFTAPGFEGVAAAFERNFTERGEVGAAFSAVLDGEVVVDLWGGTADPVTGRPWESDTLQLVFSGAKGLIATCVLMLAERGRIDLEAPVADYWPEFAAHGKGGTTVVEMLSHRARLPGVRTPLAPEDLADSVRLAALLAAQEPEDDPRGAYIYHPLTYGWLADGLVRRVDGRGVGRFFAEEIAAPLGLEVWIGVPPEHEGRVSRLTLADGVGAEPGRERTGDPLADRVQANPPLLLRGGDLYWNTPLARRSPPPGAGAVVTARSMARFYGALARGGELDGVRIIERATLDLGRAERVKGIEPLWGAPMAYGAGYELQAGLNVFGRPADAYGHAGMGGSRHAAWPGHGLGFSYAMNQLRGDAPDLRSQSLLNALEDALA
ncbi:serine hydrolase domain-containing protein [Streptosporangium sp. NPDC051022]|uniref:serine hydrolase domain-containing protein n=1 Tax=Streptosporangium sp. NPDC051022 TaxID=3155752 RepID=UPI00341A2A6F